MNPSSNRYPGTCHACGATVKAGDGYIERKDNYRRRSTWLVWCKPCYDKSDNSGEEDRCCGDRAYEDACARACGMDY